VIRALVALALVPLALAVLGAIGAHAETYPSHPVRVIVPFAPGGSTDILARLISQKLSERTGQSFFVDNRPGAGGSIGAELAARAAPDGYTLLMGHIGTLAVNPGLYPKLGYDKTSFQPIALVAIVASFLVVHPSVPAYDVPGLIALARQSPGRLTYGSGGNGSAAHTAVTAFMEVSHTQFSHVPYRGTAPMANDLVAGQLSMTMTGGLVVLPQIRSGALRALAVTSLRRVSATPELPTIAEAASLPGFEATQWYGFVAPAGVPADIRAMLNRAINAFLAQPDIAERLEHEGAYATPLSPEDFGTLIDTERERWGALIRRTGMKPD
jgi:tripartite-type tricarboxylate transporter receptor subunit TctC